MKKYLSKRLYKILHYFQGILRHNSANLQAIIVRESKIYLIENFYWLIMKIYNEAMNDFKNNGQHSMYEARAIDGLRKELEKTVSKYGNLKKLKK